MRKVIVVTDLVILIILYLNFKYLNGIYIFFCPCNKNKNENCLVDATRTYKVFVA